MSPRTLPEVPHRRGNDLRVLVVSGSVGAGHDGAAAELAARLRRAGVVVDVRDLLDVLPGPVSRVLRDGYRLTLDRVPVVFDRLFAAIEHRGPVRSVVLAVCGLGEPGVLRWLGQARYDAVVSTYPLASQVLGELRRQGRAPMPLVTYLTDPAAHRTWLHSSVDLHLTVTAPTAVLGWEVYGVPMQVGGPLVPDRFARPCPRGQLQQLRRELGVPDVAPVALLVAGSLGLGDVVASVQDLSAARVVPLVLCGHNAALRRRVAAVPGAIALGWRDDVHELVHLADVLVQNAGGLSFTEALVAGLPAISYRCIPGHGQANAAVLHDSGLAPWARDAGDLEQAIASQLRRVRTAPLLPDPAEAVLALLHRDTVVPPLPAALAVTA